MDALVDVDPDVAAPLNLFRVHWHSDTSSKDVSEVAEHIVLSRDLAGVEATERERMFELSYYASFDLAKWFVS